MRAYKVEELLELFERLAAKTGDSLDHNGFMNMEHKLGIQSGISHRFLYKKYRSLTESSGDSATIQNGKLDPILQFLGYSKYSDFQEELYNPIPEILKSCEGKWVCYVRQNSEKGNVYQSPVKIYAESQSMVFHLQGPHQVYIGNIQMSSGTLFTLFKSDRGKQFHHVYKIGRRVRPHVLQGVFSGVSTAGDPIGGRTVLVRLESETVGINNVKLELDELLSSSNTEMVAIGNYFREYSSNNLKINPVVSFDLDDLDC